MIVVSTWMLSWLGMKCLGRRKSCSSKGQTSLKMIKPMEVLRMPTKKSLVVTLVLLEERRVQG